MASAPRIVPSPARWAKAPLPLITASVHAPPWTLQVYVYLDALALERGWWECTQGDIAQALDVDRTAVSRAIAWLVDREYLRAERVGRYETRFELCATRTPRVFGAVRQAHTSNGLAVRQAHTYADRTSLEQRGSLQKKRSLSSVTVRDFAGAQARLEEISKRQSEGTGK